MDRIHPLIQDYMIVEYDLLTSTKEKTLKFKGTWPIDTSGVPTAMICINGCKEGEVIFHVILAIKNHKLPAFYKNHVKDILYSNLHFLILFDIILGRRCFIQVMDGGSQIFIPGNLKIHGWTLRLRTVISRYLVILTTILPRTLNREMVDCPSGCLHCLLMPSSV
jgi:hypothetical protein